MMNYSDKTTTAQRDYMIEMLQQKEELLVIGLTGRIGSGCTEAAHILSSTFTELHLPSIRPGDKGFDSDEERDKRILYQYAKCHWIPFDVIKVRTVITSFMIEDFDGLCGDIERFTAKKNVSQKLEASISTLLKDKNHGVGPKEIKEKFKQIQKLCGLKNAADNLPLEQDIIALVQYPVASESTPPQTEKESDHEDRDDVNQTVALLMNFYTLSNKPEHYDIRARLIRETDELLNMISAWAAYHLWDNTEDKKQQIKDIARGLDWDKEKGIEFKKYVAVHDMIPAISSAIHDLLSKENSSVFTELYQKYGNTIRGYGKANFGTAVPEQEALEANSVIAIPKRINKFIKSLRHPFSRSVSKPTRIVIDSLKSIHEVNYLRARYSSFYLYAISTDEDLRVARLVNRKKLNLQDIACMDWNEYSGYGAEIFHRYRKELQKYAGTNQCKQLDISDDKLKEKEQQDDFMQYLQKNHIFRDDEVHFLKRVVGAGEDQIFDSVRKTAYKNHMQQFILQDVGACIQNADVFISNNHIHGQENWKLKWEIVRNVCLNYYPGLLLPTPVERCMQIAFSAKVNSGCLSRQVGAVVTDANYNILSIGWNDVPCGDISCCRKNLLDLYEVLDVQAYTKYELDDEEFRERVKRKCQEKAERMPTEHARMLFGLPWRYCFKELHADKKEPMRSRAMHAEEKALSVVLSQAEGGFLFTTSSPCEMCSKNAKNHRISRIYYIEPYPGISEDQYSNSGDPSNRAKHILFSGAIGKAYTQMYTPIMPHKDILKFLGM